MKQPNNKITISATADPRCYYARGLDGTATSYELIADIRRISEFAKKPVLLRMTLMVPMDIGITSSTTCLLAQETCILKNPDHAMAVKAIAQEPMHNWANCEAVAETAPLATDLLMFMDAYYSRAWTKYKKLVPRSRHVVENQIKLMQLVNALKQ